MPSNEWALQVAARTLCQEARGEPVEGQEAVAHVIKNRLLSKRWGNSLATVCLWPYQFSGWRGPQDPNFTYACTLRDDDATLRHMMSVMQAAMDSNKDPTSGATHYVNLDVAKPAWASNGILCCKIGHHSFFRGVA